MPILFEIWAQSCNKRITRIIKVCKKIGRNITTKIVNQFTAKDKYACLSSFIFYMIILNYLHSVMSPKSSECFTLSSVDSKESRSSSIRTVSRRSLSTRNST